MNWTLAILQAIIIAGISALISYFVARRQKSLEFKYDYNKYILDKRKIIYDQIEEILGRIDTNMHNPERTRKVKAFMFDEKENPIRKFNERLIAVLCKGYWMSEEMNSELYKLNQLFMKMTKEIGYNIDLVLEFQVAEKYHNEIDEIYKNITQILFNDLINLDDIGNFKKRKYLV